VIFRGNFGKIGITVDGVEHSFGSARNVKIVQRGVHVDGDLIAGSGANDCQIW